MDELFIPIRWIHVLAASVWVGEVCVINFVLIPSLSRFDGEFRRRFLGTVFPKIFRMASVLSVTTVITGVVLLVLYTRGNLEMLLSGRRGLSILIGGSMGILLTLFHFFMENQMAHKAGIGRPDTSDETLEDIHSKIRVVPRIGLGVIILIYLIMMYATRGL